MLKKIGLPMIALAGILAFGAPRAAEARVHFRVAIGGPVYTAPYPYLAMRQRLMLTRITLRPMWRRPRMSPLT